MYPLVDTSALGAGYGFAGPVAGMLPKSGQTVEHRGLSHVWVAGQGDYLVLRAGFGQVQAQVYGPGSGGGVAQSHSARASVSTERGSSSRRMPEASRCRRAMTAPRIR